MNIRRLKIWVEVIKDFIISFRGSRAEILSSEETVKCVLNQNKSIIRLGDGEFNILKGKDISYQKYSISLEKDIKKILKEYFKNSKECKYLLCVPKFFMNSNGIKLIKKRVYVSSWSYSRKIFQKEFPQDIVYGDAFLFAKQNKKNYEEIWKMANKSKCIFIHNNEKYAKDFEKRYKIPTSFIKIEAKNAYEEIEKIRKEIIQKIEGINKDDIMVIISAGPAGKVLVYDLANEGILAIDAGHCWDDPLIDEKMKG